LLRRGEAPLVLGQRVRHDRGHDAHEGRIILLGARPDFLRVGLTPRRGWLFLLFLRFLVQIVNERAGARNWGDGQIRSDPEL
jgi:hypothetical protein